MSSEDVNAVQQNYNFVWIGDALFQGRYIIAGTVLAALLMAVAYCIVTPRVYYADAAVQVESSRDGLMGLDSLTNISGGPAQAAVELELLKSRWLIGKTIDALRLNFSADPKTFPLIGAYFARKHEAELPGELAPPGRGWLAKYNWGGAKIQLKHFEVPLDWVNETFELIAKDSSSYALYFDGELIGEAAVGERLSAKGVELEVESLIAHPGMEFELMRKETLGVIGTILSKLSVMERGRNTGYIVVGYKSESPELAKNIVSHLTDYYIQQNKARLAEEASASLEFLEKQLPIVRADMDKAAANLNDYQTKSGSVNIEAETRSVLEQIVGIDAALSESRIKQVEIERRFTRNHPNFRAHMLQQQELEKRKQLLERDIHELPTTQQDVFRLTRDVEVATQIYLMMLSKAQELDVIKAGTVGSVRLIDAPAVNVHRPVHPQIPFIIACGLIAGIALGIGLALLKAFFYTRIMNVAEIEALDVKIFGNIPLSIAQKNFEKSWEKSGSQIGRPILTACNTHDVGVEAFRSLRTSIHFHLMATKSKIISITGPNPNIGKSFTSVNMAMVFAQTGKRVLLIDADLRKGYLHQYFTDVDKELGLANYLVGEMPLEQVIQVTAYPHLSVIGRGAIPANPSELLMNGRLQALFEQSREDFDLIIVDTPPLMAVSDALIISQHTDMSLVVARFGYNRPSEIKKMLRLYESNGLSIAGVIVNASYKTLSNIQQGEYGYYEYYTTVEQKKV